jgi:NAD(P)-dependent dehydrogenase (short-subunit alcohol dehydrogenase family)
VANARDPVNPQKFRPNCGRPWKTSQKLTKPCFSFKLNGQRREAIQNLIDTVQSTMTSKTILITGCSSGIGYVCATSLKQRGYRVFATARKTEDVARLEAEGFEALQLDYASSTSVQACAAEVARRTEGKLFALFNNGAYGQPGALEDISRTVLEQQFAANVFGWHELTRACLPLLRSNGTGRIVQCSSVLGLAAMKWRGSYNASKYAVEGLSDTLRLELRGSGIDVITINPGPIESRFVPNARAAFEQNVDMSQSHYKDEFELQRQRLDRGGNTRFKRPASAVVDKLLLALERPSPAAHYYVTTPTWIVAVARRILPQRLLDSFLNRISDQ